MTCVVGVVHQRQVWIGAEAQTTASNGHAMSLADPKVFALEGFLFGCAGGPRVGQLIQHALALPARHPRQSVSAYMATDFIDALRGTLTRGGAIESENGTDELDATMLVGHAGRLFAVWQDFQVEEVTERFNAVGSGAPYAMGALHALKRKKMPPRARAKAALEAAVALDSYCGGPLTIERI